MQRGDHDGMRAGGGNEDVLGCCGSACGNSEMELLGNVRESGSKGSGMGVYKLEARVVFSGESSRGPSGVVGSMWDSDLLQTSDSMGQKRVWGNPHLGATTGLRALVRFQVGSLS